MNFDQGVFKIVVGPAKSFKTTDLIGKLRSYVGRVLTGNYLLVKYPKEGEKGIGEFEALETRDVDEIADAIRPETEFVFIEETHKFDPSIVRLVEGLVMSGRKLYGTAINLDSSGESYLSTAVQMAMADLFEVKTASCVECRRPASRSKKVGDHYEPVCKPHFNGGGEGRLEMTIGPMYSSKSDSLTQGFIQRAIRHGAQGLVELIQASPDIKEDEARAEHARRIIAEWRSLEDKVGFALLKWTKDIRYDERLILDELEDIGLVNTHYKAMIPAIRCLTSEEQREWLAAHPGVEEVYIEEPQFIEGEADLVRELVYQGKRVLAAGLHRDFRRMPFGDVPELLAFADQIDCRQAVCDHETTEYRYNREVVTRCTRMGTENQRLKKVNGVWVPAHHDDPIVIPGGKEGENVPQKYEAWCREHHRLPGEQPEPIYKFPLLGRK